MNRKPLFLVGLLIGCLLTAGAVSGLAQETRPFF